MWRRTRVARNRGKLSWRIGRRKTGFHRENYDDRFELLSSFIDASLTVPVFHSLEHGRL